MKLKNYIYIGFILCSISCNKQKYFGGPNQYADDFEAYQTAEDLTRIPDKYWSFAQITEDKNTLQLDTTHAHSGKKCIRFFAVKSTDNVSKCSLVKQHMAFWQGETVYFSGWFYLEGTDRADWLFLFDLEEQVAVGAGPGMRMAISGDSSAIVLEHKYNEPDIYQKKPLRFPANKWVHLEMETLLSKKKKGSVKIWQDGVLILEKYHTQTLPVDFLYDQQGTKGMYSSIEIGITANTHERDMVLFVDDISVYKK